MTTTHAPDPSSSALSDDERARLDAALASGRDHEAAGRPLDAATAYQQALRIHADPQLAHRVVRLRHEAVAEAATGPGAPSWPRSLPDPFPDAVGPPEITPDELTAATLGGAILHHGCLIVRGFQPEARAVALREKVIRALAARDRELAGTPEPGDDAWYRTFEPRPEATGFERHWVQEVGGMLMADSPLIMCELLDVFADSGATAAITEYLGEPPALSFNKCVLRKLRESSPTWHQDGAFMGADLRTVDIWLSLSDCGAGAETPGLDIVPMRVDDILETSTHGATFPNSIGQGLIDIVAADHPVQSPRFAPGDAILFDDRFVHRSGIGDQFRHERFAVESWFFASSRFPDTYVPILA